MPLAFSSSIVVRCDWLSIFFSHLPGYPVEFVARSFNSPQRLSSLLIVHLGCGVCKPPRRPPQNRDRGVEFPLQRGSLRFSRRRRLPLRLQKQLRLGEDALANRARAIAPGGIELRAL